MTAIDYPVTVRRLSDEDGGGWLATVPDLPGCMADGETPSEAVSEAADAVRSWIATARATGRPVPEPSDAHVYSGKWQQRVPKSLHGKLVERARREGVSLNTLVTAILAEGIGYRERNS